MIILIIFNFHKMSDNSDIQQVTNNISSAVNECIKNYNEELMKNIVIDEGLATEKMNNLWPDIDTFKYADDDNFKLMYNKYKELFKKYINDRIKYEGKAMNNIMNINKRNYYITEAISLFDLITNNVSIGSLIKNDNDELDEVYKAHCSNMTESLKKFIEDKVKLGNNLNLNNFVKLTIVNSMSNNIDTIQSLKVLDECQTELFSRISAFNRYMKSSEFKNFKPTDNVFNRYMKSKSENFKSTDNIGFKDSATIEKDMFDECRKERDELLKNGEDYLFEFSSECLRKDLIKISFHEAYDTNNVNALGFIQRFQKCVNESKTKLMLKLLSNLKSNIIKCVII